MPYIALIMAVRVRSIKKPLMDVIATVVQDSVASQLTAWIHPLPGAF